MKKINKVGTKNIEKNTRNMVSAPDADMHAATRPVTEQFRRRW